MTPFTKVSGYLKRKFLSCCYKENPDSSYFIRAPEPKDIYWEHLDVDDILRFKRVI